MSSLISLQEENRILQQELSRVEDLLAQSRAERDELAIKYNAISERVSTNLRLPAAYMAYHRGPTSGVPLIPGPCQSQGSAALFYSGVARWREHRCKRAAGLNCCTCFILRESPSFKGPHRSPVNSIGAQTHAEPTNCIMCMGAPRLYPNSTCQGVWRWTEGRNSCRQKKRSADNYKV